MLRLCPGCPPGFRPDGDFAWRGIPGGSEDGGFEEFVEFWVSCAIVLSSIAIRSSAHASFASSSAIRATSAGSRSATPSVDHAGGPPVDPLVQAIDLMGLFKQP